MEKEPGGVRSRGNGLLRWRQILVVAAMGIVALSLCFLAPREIITIVAIGGMLLFAGVFLVGAILIELSRSRRARGGKAREGCDGCKK